MSLYTITIHDRITGDEVADISNLCTKRHYHLSRNRSGLIELELDLFKAEDLATELGMGFYGLFAAGIAQVRITRDTKPMIGGRLLTPVPHLDENGGTLSLATMDWLELFADRHLYPSDVLTYTDTDIGQIAWNRINDTQNRIDGDIGITQGQIDVSRNIEDEQADYAKTVKELLIDYSSLSNTRDSSSPPIAIPLALSQYGRQRPNNPFRYGDGGNIKSITAWTPRIWSTSQSIVEPIMATPRSLLFAKTPHPERPMVAMRKWTITPPSRRLSWYGVSVMKPYAQ